MKLIKKEDLKDIIKDGDSVATCGFTSAMLCDHAFRGIEESFLECGHPRDLEIVSVPFIGTRTPGEGMDRLAHKGLLRGARTTHINLCPNVQKAVMNNEIYCMMYPFGCIVQLYRDMGSGKPGIISKVGLGTFIDPRIEGGGCYNPDYVTNSVRQMDFYDGGGLDVCVLSAAEVDRFGNTNVTKFGRIVGPGGYINIATGAKEAVFCGSMTAGGLEIKAGDGKLEIVSEGKKKKFVSDVEQITYSGRNAAQRGQKVTYITERAVFRLVAGDGGAAKDSTPVNGPALELIEIAPGIDLKKDVLDQIEFEVAVSPDLKLMDERIFTDGPMGLTID